MIGSCCVQIKIVTTTNMPRMSCANNGYYKLAMLSGAILLSVWLLRKYLMDTHAHILFHKLELMDTPAVIRDHANIQNEVAMIEFAKKLGNEGKPVAVAIANNAYVRLAHNWLCNTMFMGIHEQIMIIVPDALSRQQIKRKWPNVHVFQISTELGNITGARDYTTVGFQRITYYRAYIVRKILENHIDVFVFEFDAVWFKNPIPDFREKLGTGDIAAVKVTGFTWQVAIGLLYIRSTNRTIGLWTEIKRKLDALLKQFNTSNNDKLISEGLNDQLFLEDLMRQKFLNIQMVHLSQKEYADGKWYTDTNRNPTPVLINNNWVIGTENKISRAIKFKHWFWNMATEECDVDLVKKTVGV